MTWVAPPHQHTHKHTQLTYHTHTHKKWSVVATVASHEQSPNHNVLEMMPGLVSHNVYGNQASVQNCDTNVTVSGQL